MTPEREIELLRGCIQSMARRIKELEEAEHARMTAVWGNLFPRGFASSFDVDSAVTLHFNERYWRISLRVVQQSYVVLWEDGIWELRNNPGKAERICKRLALKAALPAARQAMKQLLEQTK